MAFGSGRGWPTSVGIGLLIVFSPVLLVAAWTVLVASPYDVAVGLAQVFSGRDVVQVADGEETAISLFLLLLALLGLGWLLRLRVSIVVVACGFFLVWPLVAVLAAGVEYGLQTALAGRGYDYCTFHVMSTGKGEGGTYVYVRRALPDACESVRGLFPPHHLVPDRRKVSTSRWLPVEARSCAGRQGWLAPVAAAPPGWAPIASRLSTRLSGAAVMVLAEAAFSAAGIKRASGQPYGLVPSMAKVENGRLVWSVATATIGSGWRVTIDDATGEAGRVTRWGLR